MACVVRARAAPADEGGGVGIWIGQDWIRDAHPVGGVPLAFRKDVELDGPVVDATLRITASRGYTLWVNDVLVGSGPARCFPSRQLYDELDLRPDLRPGRNSLAVIVVPAPTAVGYADVPRVGLWTDGVVRTATGTQTLATNGSWRARAAGWYAPMDRGLSFSGDPQEHLDGRAEPEGWRTRPPGEGWTDAFFLGPADTPPWARLTRRPIALLDEGQPLGRVVYRGQAVATGTEVQPLDRLTVTGRKTDEEAGWVDAAPGVLVTFDLGKTRHVRPGLEVQAVQGAPRLEVHYGLALHERPEPFGEFVDSYAPRPGASRWRALRPRECRFVTVRAAGTGRCRFRLDARALEYPFPDRARFETDDPFLGSLWRVSAETVRSSTTDAFVEARENVLWTLDACVTGLPALYLFGDTAMWRHCLTLVGEGISADGVPRSVVPAGHSFMSLVDQALFWVLSCRDHVRATGDRAFARDVAPAIARLLRRCARFVTGEGLFVPPPTGWNWVDWAPLDKRPYALPVNALLALARDAAVELGVPVGQGGGLRAALARFFDPTAGAFRDHVAPRGPVPPVHPFNATPPGRSVPHSLHANALACRAAVGTAAHRAAAVAHMAAQLRAPLGPGNKFSPGWTEAILAPVVDGGAAAEARSFLQRTYGAFLDAGAPTWGELFDGARFNTAHTWGTSVVRLLVESGLGLRPVGDGWRAVAFAPDRALVPGAASYRLETPAGPFVVTLDARASRLEAPRGVRVARRAARRDQPPVVVETRGR